MIVWPLPSMDNGQKINGLMMSLPEECKKCGSDKCINESATGLSVCSYGFHSYKDDKVHLLGFIIKNDPRINKQTTKKAQKYPANTLLASTFSYMCKMLDEYYANNKKEMQDKQEAAIQRYIKEEQYKHDFLRSVKLDIQRGLSFYHDYKQINKTIRQNINVIIETRYSGNNLEEKLGKATKEELTIYKASSILDEKLNVARFILNPEWLNSDANCKYNEFQKMIKKYVSMYEPVCDESRIAISLKGHSTNTVYANMQAISVIPHTLIDNAIKYSKAGSAVTIYVNDISKQVSFSIESYGPKIEKGEEEKIFQAFYRGKNARDYNEEGAGYGLYIAQLIAIKHLGTKITMTQDLTKTDGSHYFTKFAILLPEKCIINN